jgi:phosphoglycolate phosphatase
MQPRAILFDLDGTLVDSLVDMRTARAAGMRPIGVPWGFRERAELEENGAAHVIARPEELLGLL